MNKKDYEFLDKMVELAKKQKNLNLPKLPKGVTFKKELLQLHNHEVWGYTFKDETIGQLGRILFIPVGNETQLSAEITGYPDDPLTQKRKEIFEPIVNEIMSRMTSTCGNGKSPVQPYESPKTCVESRVFPCETCKKITSMLIFADNATTNGDLENYARMMHEKIEELKVPTWIVGDELGLEDENSPEFLTMKINKKQQKSIKVMSHDYIMKQVDKLMDNHCKN